MPNHEAAPPAPPLDLEGRMMLDNVEARLFGGTPDPTRIGEYEVLKRLGAGGMGEVYLALNPELRRLEAVKILRTSHGGDAAVRQRLLAEAHALARLSHPNVVQVYRADVAGSDVYIAMEFIDGPTVDDWQRQTRHPWRDIVRVYAAAARGLAAAHRAGLVHRDFKPSNILLGKDDPTAEGDPLARRVRVIDFGLAIAEAGAAGVSDADAPHASSLVGTPYYLSPEQCAADHPPLTPASDQFSFCVALYEALYHQHPFFVVQRHPHRSDAPTDSADLLLGTSPSGVAYLIAAIRSAPLREPPDNGVPRSIYHILRRGLERPPEQRYASMTELVARLERALQPHHGTRLAAACGAAALLGAGVGFWFFGAPAEPALCRDVPAAIADAWNLGRTAAVERAFAANASQAVYAPSAYRAVVRALDEYAAEWTEVLALACQDTYRAGTLDEAAYRRRVQCLDARRAALADTVDALIADESTIRRVDTVLAALPPVGDCASLQAPRCGDPAALAEQPAIRDALARARADERAGRFAAAAESAALAQQYAVAHGDPALLAEVAFVHGRLLTELSRWNVAAAALQTAYITADGAGCDELAIDAVNHLAKSVALDPDPSQAATDWSPVALARIDRVYAAATADDDRQSNLMRLRKAEAISNRGLLRQRKQKDPLCRDASANCMRDLQGASDDFRVALQLRETIEPAPLVELSVGYRNLGAVLFQLGRADEGLDYLEHGLALADAAFGAGNPATWKAHFDLGKALAGLGRDDEAGQHLQAALDLAVAGHDPGNLKIGEAHLELALHQEDRGDLEQARPHTQEALAIFEALPPGHPRRFNALRMLGHLQQQTGAHARAWTTRERILTETPHGDLTELATSHIEIADTASSLRRPQDALRHAELALDLLDMLAAPADDPLRGEAQLHRGTALLELGEPGALDTLQAAEAAIRKNLSTGVIDPALWVHAAWEVARRSCTPPPAELREYLTDPSLAAIAAAVAAYDLATCHPWTPHR